jgi:tyrosyl-tRNA synthetase
MWLQELNVKVTFAQEIVARFHSLADAEKALMDFQTRSKGGIPDEVPEVTVTIDADNIGVAQLLKLAGLVSSTSEAFRAIEQGGIKLDGEKVSDKAFMLNKGTSVVAQVGKRKFANVTIL